MSHRKSLDVIEVKEPCHVAWDAMRGNDQSRFCGQCRKHVHNLSAMSSDEAERLICENAGSLCVRFEKTAEGAVRTLEYRRRFAVPRKWRIWGVIGICAAATVGVVDAWILFRKPPVQSPAQMPVMGEMAVMPTTRPVPVITMGVVCPPPPNNIPAK